MCNRIIMSDLSLFFLPTKAKSKDLSLFAISALSRHLYCLVLGRPLSKTAMLKKCMYRKSVPIMKHYQVSRVLTMDELLSLDLSYLC